jgi:hypothetical protein
MANDFDSDAMLSFVGQLNKSFQDLLKTLTEIGNQSGTGLRKAGDEMEKFGEKTKKHAGTSIKEMNTGLKEMAGALVGPIGIAAGLYKVGEALSTFATGQQRLQNFAKDTGIAATSVEKLRAAGEHMGYTVEETNQILKEFSGAVNELHIDRQASSLWRDLGRIRDGGYQVAQTIERMKAEGKDNAEIQEYAAGLIVQQLHRQTDEGNRAAAALSAAFKIPLSYAEQLVGAKKKIKDEDLLILTPEQMAKQEQYNDAWIKMKRRFWKDLAAIEQSGIELLVDAQKKHEEGDFFQKMREKDIKESREWLNYFKEKLFGATGEGAAGPSGGKDLDLDLRDPVTGLPAKNAIQMPSLAAQSREVVETQKESKDYLHQIRDILEGFDAKKDGGGGVPGGFGSSSEGGGGYRGSRGWSGNRGVGGASGDIEDSSGEGLKGSEYLAARRARMKEELDKDPALKERVAATILREHPSDPVAVAESLFNRADYTKSTVRERLTGAFYGPIRRGMLPGAIAELNRNPKLRESIMRGIDTALGGSNLLHGATDQGSGNDPNVRWQGGRIVRHGEVYNDWGGGPGGHAGAAKFRENLERHVRGEIDRNRAKIDSALRTGDGNLGGAHITVDFNGVPKDVKTNAELLDEGVFKTLKLNRSAGQAAMSGQNTAPQNSWSAGE